MTTMTRAMLNSTAARKFARVTVDGKIHPDEAEDLGDNFRIQTISLPEMDSYERVVYDKEGEFQSARLPLRRRKLIQLALIDDDGNRLFSADELPSMQMDGGISAMLFVACAKFTGVNADERVTVGDAKKNSRTTNDSSTLTESVSPLELTTPNSGTRTPTPKS